MLEKLNYPLDFTFKTLAFAPQFSVTDANHGKVAFIKQKLFKFKEEVKVYKTESQVDLQYTINADRWLDWSASYLFETPDGTDVGRVARQGGKSLWKAHYDVIDAAGAQQFTIRERSAATRFFDGLFGEIPIIGLFTGYIFNPTYDIRRMDGTQVAIFTKEPSAIGRRFKLDRLDQGLEGDQETAVILSLMMMVLLERSRG